ncbi:MAG: N-6 DNA methylase [Armatimonadota bacterium]|nr:N-6 DNA methylase [Armatimonadota bacterium]
MRTAGNQHTPGQGVLRLSPVNNRDLFAHNYIDNRLPELLEWRNPDGIEEAFRAILDIYNQKATGLANANEAQTELDFVRPVLGVLWGEQQTGDCYQVQAVIPTLDGRRQPDYAFFRRAADREAADTRRGTIEYWRDAPCLGDAKAWSAGLDKQRGVDDNPSAQIASYLHKSRVRWGILTNGRIWRLYEREKSAPGGIYFEVNLEDILLANDRDGFKWFYLFFRRQAFTPGADGKTFVEEVFQGSVDYATQVGDRLKESVYDAIRHLINGFFERAENKLNPRNPDHLTLVHDNSLILLYRLLFLFYAEDKGLLPPGHPVYRDYSLKRLQKLINEEIRAGREHYSGERRFWPQISNLFELIDGGLSNGEKTVVPAYNGGLFSEEKHPHIGHTPQPGVIRWQIGDDRLAQVIDTLAYERERWDEPGDKDIDYNTLEVQHLGSIYEGLLELQPRVADEAMVEVSAGGKSMFKPEKEVADPRPIRGQPRRVASGEVYLVTDRGERKATGSYYTPKYIVDYIAANTVGELADEAAGKVVELRSEVDKEIFELRERRRQWKAKPDGYDPAEVARQIANIDGEIEKEKLRLLEPYLSLSVLDPAMGSGHFLVGAADLLSLAMATDPNILPMEDIGNEDPQAHYKRLVVERCLYGVDLNPLAVELAKLSLWLHTVSRGKALSFLDHHLRAGNSLIGANIEDDLSKEPPLFNGKGKRVNAENPQLVLGFAQALQGEHLSSLLALLDRISQVPTHDREGERLKEQLYEELERKRERFRAVANCWLAPFFGSPVTAQEYEKAVAALRGSDAAWRKLARERWFVDAQKVATAKRFFHWELEFPEVFFTPTGLKAKEERGFDTVVGNPPYGAGQDRALLASMYVGARGNSDNYAAFIDLAIGKARESGRVGLITPQSWQTGVGFRDLRVAVLGNESVTALVNLPYDVFPDAYVDTSIVVVRKAKPESGHCFGIKVFDKTADCSDLSQVTLQPVRQTDMASHRSAVGQDQREISLVMRLVDNVESRPLSDITRSTRGIRALPCQVSSECKGETWKPFFLGEVDRYATAGSCLFVDFTDKLPERPIDAALFEGERLLMRRLVSRQDRLMGCMVRANFIVKKDLYVLHGCTDVSYGFLLALLNSRLVSYIYVHTDVAALKDDFRQVTLDGLRALPIRRIAFSTPDAERVGLLTDAKQAYETYLTVADSAAVLGFVEHQLSAVPERADVIHDLLAFLAEQMIEMNKQKHAEEAGFLAYLERGIGAKADDLTNKTKIRDYHGRDFETLLDVLRKNSKKLKANPDARKFQEDLRREFDSSVGKLSPLKERIAATDRLIDQIVYKLYGLTEEEIRIVEGEANADPTARQSPS